MPCLANAACASAQSESTALRIGGACALAAAIATNLRSEGVKILKFVIIWKFKKEVGVVRLWSDMNSLAASVVGLNAPDPFHKQIAGTRLPGQAEMAHVFLQHAHGVIQHYSSRISHAQECIDASDDALRVGVGGSPVRHPRRRWYR